MLLVIFKVFNEKERRNREVSTKIFLIKFYYLKYPKAYYTIFIFYFEF